MSYIISYDKDFFKKSCEDCQFCDMSSGSINEFYCLKGNMQTSFDEVIDKNGDVKHLSFPERYISPNVFKDGNHVFEAEEKIMKEGCPDFQKFQQ